MKNTVLLTALLFLGAVQLATAQKFGYTNVDYIIAYMPEYQTAQTQLNEYGGQLQAQLQSKVATFQEKRTYLEQNYGNLIPAVVDDLTAELQQLQTSIQQFEANAQQLVQAKELELIQPLYGKVQEAINAVAEANGYTYIFEANSLLYAPEGDEISALIFAQLGIEVPEETEPATAPETGGQ